MKPQGIVVGLFSLACVLYASSSAWAYPGSKSAPGNNVSKRDYARALRIVDKLRYSGMHSKRETTLGKQRHWCHVQMQVKEKVEVKPRGFFAKLGAKLGHKPQYVTKYKLTTDVSSKKMVNGLTKHTPLIVTLVNEPVVTGIPAPSLKEVKFTSVPELLRQWDGHIKPFLKETNSLPPKK